MNLLISKEEIRLFAKTRTKLKSDPKEMYYASAQSVNASAQSSEFGANHNESYREYCDSKHQRRHITTQQEAVPSIKRHARKWAGKAVSTNRDQF